MRIRLPKELCLEVPAGGVKKEGLKTSPESAESNAGKGVHGSVVEVRITGEEPHHLGVRGVVKAGNPVRTENVQAYLKREAPVICYREKTRQHGSL